MNNLKLITKFRHDSTGENKDSRGGEKYTVEERSVLFEAFHERMAFVVDGECGHLKRQRYDVNGRIDQVRLEFGF